MTELENGWFARLTQLDRRIRIRRRQRSANSAEALITARHFAALPCQIVAAANNSWRQ